MAGLIPACSAPDVDPEIFFPESTADSAADKAKAVCARCDLQSGCLAFALENGIDDGVWGGLSERARRRIRKRMSHA